MSEHYYGKVSIHPFKAFAHLVGVEGTKRRVSAWTISPQKLSEFKLGNGDIVRATVPSLDSEYCNVIEKVNYE